MEFLSFLRKNPGEKKNKKTSRAGRREIFFWDLRCDSLLPESIPDCKSVEISQNFPPPAGSFSETSKKVIKISASGGVIHNVTSTEAPQAALLDHLTSTEAPRAALFHNMKPVIERATSRGGLLTLACTAPRELIAARSFFQVSKV